MTHPNPILSPNKHEKQTEEKSNEVWTTIQSPEPERLI